MAPQSYRERLYGDVGDPERARIIAIEQKAKQAFAANNAFIALANPTAAQVTAHAKVMARELNGVFRLLFGDFTVDDT